MTGCQTKANGGAAPAPPMGGYRLVVVLRFRLGRQSEGRGRRTLPEAAKPWPSFEWGVQAAEVAP